MNLLQLSQKADILFLQTTVFLTITGSFSFEIESAEDTVVIYSLCVLYVYPIILIKW